MTIQAISTAHLGSFTKSLPGNRLMSQLSCFLEILVQLRSRETGCRRMMPLSIKGVMDLQWFRSMRVHNRLSQHLGVEPDRKETSSELSHPGKACLATLTLPACHLQGGSSFKIQPSNLLSIHPAHIWAPLLTVTCLHRRCQQEFSIKCL